MVARAVSQNIGRVFGGRFQAKRLLKSGQGVETLLGERSGDGLPVVIKVAPLASLSPSTRLRLEYEAAALSELRNHHFAAILHLGFEAGVVALVRELAEGVTLQERLGAGTLEPREALRIGVAILSALGEVHARRVVHRDIKPGNIVIDGPIRPPRLIDFGLARVGQIGPSLRELDVSSIRCLSPEQAGLISYDVGVRSDLYSFGAVLFECLAGRPAFDGTTVREVLRQQVAEQPPPLRSLGVQVPRAVDEVVARLLRKDPRDRYQSSDAVLADLQTIASALERGETDPFIPVGARDRRGTLADPALIGRARELSALDVHWDLARAGKGGLVLLEGESGVGKSRLLDELAGRGAQSGGLVLRGQGVEQAAARPFQLFSSLAAALLDRAPMTPELGTRIGEALGDLRDAACEALPDLADLVGERQVMNAGPEQHGETRSVAALSALLGALGTEERPAMVLLDDCQWADGLTFKVLAEWQRGVNGSGGGQAHLLVLAAFRAEEVGADHPLRALQASGHIPLRSLADGDVRLLLESMAGHLPREGVEVVQRLSEGNPFLASAVLEGLVEAGALHYSEDGWAIDADVLRDVQSSRRSAGFLAQRLAKLPPQTLRLVSVGALLGKTFDLELAATLGELPPQEAIQAVEEARRRRLLWSDARGARYTFVHDRLREALIERLPDDERRRLHRRAAERIEAADPHRVFELAYHYDAAGDPRRALPFALDSAAQARRQNDLGLAESQYRIAERGVEDAADETRRRIAEELGDVLLLRGRYDDAAEKLGLALALSSGSFAKAQIYAKLGDLAFKRGLVRVATDSLESALRLLGRHVPRRRKAFAWLALWEGFVQLLHTYLPRLFVGRRRGDPPPAERLAIRLFNRLQYPYYFACGRFATLWTHLRMLNLAERYGVTDELGQAYASHAVAACIVPMYRRAIAYGERALPIHRATGNLWGLGIAQEFLGIALFTAGRFQECIRVSQDALRLLERSGDRWEYLNALNHISRSQLALGDLRAAAEGSQRRYRLGKEIGDKTAISTGVLVWSLAAGGRVSAELLAAERAAIPSDDVLDLRSLDVADGFRLLCEGRLEEAVSVLRDADRGVAATSQQTTYVTIVPLLLAQALRRLAECTPLGDGDRRRELLREARRTALRGLAQSRRFPNDLAFALRELAHIEALFGRRRRARHLLEESLAVAKRRNQRLQQAWTRHTHGLLGTWFHWAGAQEDLAAARRELLDLDAGFAIGGEAATPAVGRGTTLSLADRFAAVLDAGRRIATALTAEAVHAAVREATLALLRADECQIIAVRPKTDGGSADLSSMLGGGAFRRSHVLRALELGRAVTAKEESTATGGGMGSSTARSALCSPVYVRERPVACFYVTHREVAGLFGEEEEQLAQFIATIAGAALENAEGFAEIQAMSRTLEQRVEERTAQLAAANREMEAALWRLRSTQEQLLQMAITDELTGLYTRRYLVEALQQHIEALRRVPGSLTCLMVDVDHFKRINDSFGHSEGDRVLREIAATLRNQVRASDLVARYGGEEFVVFLPSTGQEDGHRVAEKLRAAVERSIHTDSGSVTLSIGVAGLATAAPMFPARDATALAAELLKRADDALYVAKREGRNRIAAGLPVIPKA